MNIKEKLADLKAAYHNAKLKGEIPTEYLKVNRRSPMIFQLHAERLRVKNERRAIHGLPPKATYAEI